MAAKIVGNMAGHMAGNIAVNISAGIPKGAYLKDLSPHINAQTIPNRLRVFSGLDPETWGQVVVSEGEVNLLLEGQKPKLLSSGVEGIIPPGTRFNLESSGENGRFQILYYHEKSLDDGKELASLLSRT